MNPPSIHGCHRDWPWCCIPSCRASIKFSNLSFMFPVHFLSDSCHFSCFLNLKIHIVWNKSRSFFLYLNRNSWNKFLFVFNAYMLHFHLPWKWSKCTQQYAPYSAMTVDRLENFEKHLSYFTQFKFSFNGKATYEMAFRIHLGWFTIIVFNFSAIFPTSHLTWLRSFSMLFLHNINF